MKNSVWLCLFLFLSAPVYSQTAGLNNQVFQKKNSTYIEAGGYTGIGAVYYERIIVNNPKFKILGQAGYGLTGWPVGLNGLTSFNKHHIEYGGCITFPDNIITNLGAPDSYLTGRLGYRLQKPDGRFIFRAGLMPVVIGADKESGPELILWVWPGISFGMTF